MSFEELFVTGDLEEKVIVFEGHEYKLKVRPVSWAYKTNLAHKCLSYNAKGLGSFDYGTYVEEMLRYMIAEAPWGVTTPAFLKKLKPEFGIKLEALVPMPEGAKKEESDFFDQASNDSLTDN